ncbi:Nitrogen permease regulator 2 [Perkinsus olseni]|uniref:Nitrogen permease regulator 2 n=1 Tax=Perkinsus olseni TaxID=32597 RepID=A0A7J6LQR8_PEROL|nr:Nitrogen permease regulator 2 [Perkinsus olseni]
MSIPPQVETSTVLTLPSVQCRRHTLSSEEGKSSRRGSGSGRGSVAKSQASSDHHQRNLSILTNRRRGSHEHSGVGDDILNRVLHRRSRQMSSRLQELCWDVFGGGVTDELLLLCVEGTENQIHSFCVGCIKKLVKAIEEHDADLVQRQVTRNGLTEQLRSDDVGPLENEEKVQGPGVLAATESSVDRHRSLRQDSGKICIDEGILEDTLSEFLATLLFTCLNTEEYQHAKDTSMVGQLTPGGKLTPRGSRTLLNQMQPASTQLWSPEEVTPRLAQTIAAGEGMDVPIAVGGMMPITAGGFSPIGAAATTAGHQPPPARRWSMGNIRYRSRCIVKECLKSNELQLSVLSDRKYRRIRPFIPWRLRFMLGSETSGSAKAWREVQYTKLERETMWRAFGQPTHWLTLEFADDASLEKGFQVHFAERARRYPYWYFLLTACLIVLYCWLQYEILRSNHPSVTFVRVIMTEPTALFFFAAIVKLSIEVIFLADSLWFVENYFPIQLLLAALSGSAVLFWMYWSPLILKYYIWPLQEALTYSVLMAFSIVLFKLRFIHILYLSVYLLAFLFSARWIALGTYPFEQSIFFHEPLRSVAIIVAPTAVLATIRYMFELLALQDPSKVEDGNLVDQLGHPLRIRVGIHSGHCVAGVIGRKKFIYDVWGDCVNTASRMESHGTEMRVHCSEDTANEVRDSFDLTCRGVMQVKGKGLMTTYYINKERKASKKRDYRGSYGESLSLSHAMVTEVEDGRSGDEGMSSDDSSEASAGGLWENHAGSENSARIASLNEEEIVGMTRRRLSSTHSDGSPRGTLSSPRPPERSSLGLTARL